MGMYKTFAVDYFFLFNERMIEETKYYRACTNLDKPCPNSKGKEIYFHEMKAKEPEKFCELCGHRMHKYEKVSSITTNDASDILESLYDKEDDDEIIEQMQDLILTPESRDPRFASYNYNIRDDDPDFEDNDTFLLMDKSFKLPKINAEHQKRIDFILNYVNSRLGENTVELRFGAYTYSH